MLHTASLEELTGKLRHFGDITSMRATVEMQIAVLSDDRKKRTEYTDVRGAVVTRRPGFIRVQAQTPVTGQRAFDMVSDGETFRVHIPWKKRFFEGRNALDKPSEKRLENIRPQHILDALMIDPPAEDEVAVLDNVVQGSSAYHVVTLLHRNGSHTPHITRKVWFDRVSLNIARVQIYNDHADVVTDARYLGWASQGELPWAGTVIISRPGDGYTLTVRTLKPGLNEDVPERAFVLEPPEGLEIEKVGSEKTEEATAQANK